ncbi:unnamed protein product [Blepharisma stoltei]|uniref:ADP,ATP carrier protein n=1 Tax=Blepharisma stoltei TaxID=1481888 RepID=A0AAU9KR76_9CILI|nr:unnamed protein product [Blepharisma stoltei]
MAKEDYTKNSTIASAFGIATGIISKTLVSPLDRIQLILQSQSLNKLPANEKYNGMFNFLWNVRSREGIRAIWRGNFATIINILPRTTIRLHFHLWLRNRITKNQGSFVWEMMTSGISSGVSLLSTYPLDIIRTRLMTDLSSKRDTRNYKGVIDCFKKISNEEGIKGFYKGSIITFLGLVPYLGLSTYTFNLLADYYFTTQKQAFLGINEYYNVMKWNYPYWILDFFGVASVATGISKFLVYPLETIKAKMQVSGARGYEAGYSSYRQCVADIVKREGVLGFYRGFFVCVVKAAPATTLYMTIFEWFNQYTKMAL